MLPFSACRASAPAAIYYVDYGSGSDLATGDSPQAAWKHAPGDPAATDRSKAAILRPGDVVRFRGGVMYRGSIRVPASGTPDAPITFVGNEWGDGPALFDGSDPVTSVGPCPSEAACGGAPSWRSLDLVEFTPPHTALVKFFDATGALFESQSPEPADPMFSDDIAHYETLALSQRADAEQGRIRSTKFASMLRAGVAEAQLSIWVYGNQVVRCPVTGVSGDEISFTAGGINLYNDRPDRIALVNAPSEIDEPGQYAVIAPGRAVVWLRSAPNGSSLEVGDGRGAINLAGHSNIVFRGFTFQHYVGIAPREGVQITNYGEESSGIVVANNTFRESSLYSRAGVVTVGAMRNVRVEGNTISNIERGSGIRAGITPISDITVVGNDIDRVGGTAILFMDASNIVISRNNIRGAYGVHGNGISLYLTNRNIEVSHNTITESARPMTFHGDGKPAPGDNHFLITDNIFVSTDAEAAAITSWGRNTRDVVIRDNTLIAPKYALKLSATDSRVTVEDNKITGMIISGPQPADWTVRGNQPVPSALLRTLQLH